MRKKDFKKGFTLIELLVVVAIIGIIASVILVALNGARDKGADAAVKSNLANARNQAEIFYNTNTAVPDSYTNVCTNGMVGGAKGIGEFVLEAGQATGLTAYNINGVPQAPSLTRASCNQSAAAWAAEAPLKTAGQMWCVDSLGKSKQTTSSIAGTAVCP